MRGLILGLAFVLLTGSAFAGGDPEIVIYDSYAGVFGGIQAARLAAAFVSSDVKSYGAGQEANWIADVNDGADIVVFDVCSNYTTSPAPPQVLSAQLDAMLAYHDRTPDGCGILSLWFMGFEFHPIYGYYGVSRCSDFSSVIPLYQWGADAVWTGVPNPVQQSVDVWAIDGHMVDALAGTEVLGGFSAGPAPCMAGLVANHSRHTWFIGETGNGGQVDADTDGIYDWVEMYVNIMEQCGAGPTATEHSTWGEVKNLYR